MNDLTNFPVFAAQNDDGNLSVEDLARLAGLTNQAIHKRMRRGLLPQPEATVDRRIAWSATTFWEWAKENRAVEFLPYLPVEFWEPMRSPLKAETVFRDHRVDVVYRHPRGVIDVVYADFVPFSDIQELVLSQGQRQRIACVIRRGSGIDALGYEVDVYQPGPDDSVVERRTFTADLMKIVGGQLDYWPINMRDSAVRPEPGHVPVVEACNRSEHVNVHQLRELLSRKNEMKGWLANQTDFYLRETLRAAWSEASRDMQEAQSFGLNVPVALADQPPVSDDEKDIYGSLRNRYFDPVNGTDAERDAMAVIYRLSGGFRDTMVDGNASEPEKEFVADLEECPDTKLVLAHLFAEQRLLDVSYPSQPASTIRYVRHRKFPEIVGAKSGSLAAVIVPNLDHLKQMGRVEMVYCDGMQAMIRIGNRYWIPVLREPDGEAAVGYAGGAYDLGDVLAKLRGDSVAYTIERAKKAPIARPDFPHLGTIDEMIGPPPGVVNH